MIPSKHAFDKIMAAFKDAIAMARGEADPSTWHVHVPAEVDVKAIRRKLGMTQAEFARSFGFGLDAGCKTGSRAAAAPRVPPAPSSRSSTANDAVRRALAA